MKLEQIQLVISGRVQGVGFRYSTLIQAKRYGITGWVKNLPDASVEVFAEGELGKLSLFLDWCHQGPPQGRVENLVVSERKTLPSRNFERFEIVR